MAIHPNTFMSKQSLQPGGRGEIFQQDMPGYRGQGDRINRTNMKLAVSEHDVPNIKYELDRRLPVLFRYGWAHGYNQIVMPKGRLIAVDKSLNILDFDTKKAYNALTLANGGADVKLRGSDYQNVQNQETAPVGIGTQWTPLAEGTYEKTSKNEVIFRPFSATVAGVAALAEDCEVEGKAKSKAKAAKTAVIGVDAATGLVTIDGVPTKDVRLGNIPVGILERNEYTRNDDAYNGMQPGAVLTDKLIELPMFLEKEKAEMNPWGSAYGNFLPGDLVKSDENGRAVVSPLSRPEVVAKMTAAEIELERQQVVGQVYAVSRDLVPAGAAKYAQWALSDRLNFDEFNPDIWRMNNRDGEDNIEQSPYKVNGGGFVNSATDMTGKEDQYFEQPGYPWDRTMHEHDLHMLASTMRTHSNRFGLEHMLEQGIPGLTDGYNVAARELGVEEVGSFRQAASDKDYKDMLYKTADVSLESMKIAVTTNARPEEGDFVEVNVKEIGQKVDLKGAAIANAMEITYVNLKQGVIRVKVAENKATEVHGALADGKKATIFIKCTKRGLTGVPTNLDWDGCAGVVTILLQK